MSTRRRVLARPWLRSLAAGLFGTTVMTVTMALERRLRPGNSPVDYDATGHVVTAASTVLRWTPRTDRQEHLLFLLVHWGYGSAVGAGYPLAARHIRGRAASAGAFFAACQFMACTLFPVLGGTPPPWRWRRDILMSSLLQHAIYAGTVSAVMSTYGMRDFSPPDGHDTGRDTAQGATRSRGC